MKVNYDFYDGQDHYSDGEVERDIINYLEKYGEKNYQEIFKKDIRWPVFYHITPLRKNIINWYPFKEESEVLEIGAGMGAITGALCEKAEQVTAIELSKQRASAIEARCKEKENLEIIVGNFNAIKFDKKFDYITLIGVLEYAPLYTGTETPFHDFLKKIKGLLKEDGKLLIAIENQFGMKYFSGASEDHTGKAYDGLIGYENIQNVRTYGKEEIKRILEESGFGYTNFYYPLPDYKLPNIIFSDYYLPNSENIKKYTPYVSEEDKPVNYDEKKAYIEVIRNHKFDFFANSFFIEASMTRSTTEVDLSKQKLIPIDEIMQKFYQKHFSIEKIEEAKRSEFEELKEKNQKLREELSNIIHSKSWKITKPLREIRNKGKKEKEQ